MFRYSLNRSPSTFRSPTFLKFSGNAAAFSQTNLAASDPNAGLPASVWMQTYPTLTALTAGVDGGLRVFLWTTVGSAGYWCRRTGALRRERQGGT